MSDIERAQRIVAMGRQAIGNGAPRLDAVDYCVAALAHMDSIDDVAWSLAAYVAKVASIGHPATANSRLFAELILAYGRRIHELGGIPT